MKFDIQVDNKTITQSTLLHDDIPVYNLPTLEFVLPLVDDDKDLIHEEENPEIYVHLENVLVHMINAQDFVIFKSQKDYVRNKQKLLEYICHAPNVICVQQSPHAHFSVAPTMIHMGTNQKAQQSCGSGNNRE